MSDNTVISCPRCGQKMQVPASTGTVHVTCPKCREEWDWPKPRPSFRQRFKCAGATGTGWSSRGRNWSCAARGAALEYRRELTVGAVMLLVGLMVGYLEGYRHAIEIAPAPVSAPPAVTTSNAAPVARPAAEVASNFIRTSTLLEIQATNLDRDGGTNGPRREPSPNR